MKQIQDSNGNLACHRFIISNCQQASDILQLMELFLWNGWEENNLTIDFVPLFETVHDLANAAKIMETLYLMQSPANAACLMESIAQFKTGKATVKQLVKG